MSAEYWGAEGEGTMTYEDLRDFTRRQPFQPFRLFLTGGSAFDVYRQDGHVLTRHYLVIGLPGQQGGIDYDRTTMIDLLHIVRIEPITPPSPPQAYGQAAG
jgi:hypothetical protein